MTVTNPIAGMNHFLETITKPIGSVLGLRHFARNFPLIAYATLGFTAIHVWLAPWASRRFAPASYGKLQSKRARNNWDIHIVSFANAFSVIYLAARALNVPELELNKGFAWHTTTETANAVACGYFLWDTIDAIVNFTDLGFVLHGLACFFTYILTFGPYLQYYSCRFLLWEISTVFLNIHWFMDKTGHTGSTYQLVNGIFLLGTFVGVRLGYGWYTNIGFFRTLFSIRHEVPVIYWIIFLTGHLTINILNIIWLSKMIRALRKRFENDADKQPLLPPPVSDSAHTNPTPTSAS